MRPKMRSEVKIWLTAWAIVLGIAGGITGIFHLHQLATGPAPANKNFGLLQKTEDGKGYEAMLGSYDGETIFIPQSDERFDVISVTVDRNSDIIAGTGTVVWLRIRSNDGSSLYMDRAEGMLEIPNWAGWRTLEWSENGRQEPVQKLSEDSQRRYAGTQRGGMYLFSRILYPNVSAEKYRLTLYFTENRDGSGQKYTLQLVLSPRGE